jgi:hypothetical protein
MSTTDSVPFPPNINEARKWASAELKRRKLTRFLNESSHVNFELVVSPNGERLFEDGVEKIKDLKYPADFHKLYGWVHSRAASASNRCQSVGAEVHEVAQTAKVAEHAAELAAMKEGYEAALGSKREEHAIILAAMEEGHEIALATKMEEHRSVIAAMLQEQETAAPTMKEEHERENKLLDFEAEIRASQDYDFSEEHEFEMTDEAQCHFQTSEQFARMTRPASNAAEDLLNRMEMMHVADPEHTIRPAISRQRAGAHETRADQEQESRTGPAEVVSTCSQESSAAQQQVNVTIVPVSGDPFQLSLPHGACASDAKVAIAARCGIIAGDAKLFVATKNVSALAFTSDGSLQDDTLLRSCSSRELFLVVQGTL